MSSDSELVRACLDNSQVAWNQLVDRFARLVYSTTRNWGLNDSDSDDVFQTVFTILFRRLGSLRDADRLGSWLVTTTRRECWRLGRNHSTTSTVEAFEGDLAEAATADAEQLEEQYLVWRALEELGGPCETLLRALFTRGGEESYASLADRLGMEIGSIGPTRARCFGKLESILRRLGVGPESASGT